MNEKIIPKKIEVIVRINDGEYENSFTGTMMQTESAQDLDSIPGDNPGQRKLIPNGRIGHIIRIWSGCPDFPEDLFNK